MAEASEIFGSVHLLCGRCGIGQTLAKANEHRCRGGNRMTKPKKCRVCNESFIREEVRQRIRHGELKEVTVKVPWKGREIAAHVREHLLRRDSTEDFA